jgi:phosphoribosyl 1,2-cyclic phosphodiesterase
MPENPRHGSVTFWGVRGSIPSPGPDTAFFGGNTSCVEMRADEEIVILDAGSGIRPLGLELEKEFKTHPLKLTLLISHLHWDHIHGFPFFRPAYHPENRIRIVGFGEKPGEFRAALVHQMEPPFFPIPFSEMEAAIEIEQPDTMHFQIGKVKVSATKLNHPGVAVGYRLETSSGSVCYLPDNEPVCRVHASKEKKSIDSILVEFVRGAEMLIADSQYSQAEYNERVGWGHGCVNDVVELACKANVKQLFLFHHDPDHDDAAVRLMLDNARQLAVSRCSDLKIEAAREGAAFPIALLR